MTNYITYNDALHEFEPIRQTVIEQYGADDEPALNEAWSEFTDSLCKEGRISDLQYHHWPAIDSEDTPDDDDVIDWHLETLGITMEAEFIPASRTTRPDQINWRVTIERGEPMEVHYSQGIAHLPFYNHADRSVMHKEAVDYALEHGKAPRQVGSHVMTRPLEKPDLKDVVYCLVMDTQDADLPFEDWCGEFGYSDDSIAARKMYDTVQDQARTWRRMFSESERDLLRELFEDY